MNPSGGGVPGAGGVSASPNDLANGIAAVPTIGQPFGVANCPLKDRKHWVKVELKYKDSKAYVPAAEATILQGREVVNGGPLANGVLESRQLPGLTYSVTFPDIDATEWAEG